MRDQRNKAYLLGFDIPHAVTGLFLLGGHTDLGHVFGYAFESTRLIVDILF